jgi:hypothetical protein
MIRRSIRLCGQQVDQPGRIRAFFASRDEECDTLLPYIMEGVENGEHVLNVLDAARLADHDTRLGSAGVATNGQMTVASSEDTYLAGGRFDMERTVDFVRAQLERSAAEGKVVRTTGLDGLDSPRGAGPPETYLKELVKS